MEEKGIIFFSANSSNTESLDVGDELATIEEILSTHESKHKFRLKKTQTGSNKERILRLLEPFHSSNLDIVHFSGHGNEYGNLIIGRKADLAEEIQSEIGYELSPDEFCKCFFAPLGDNKKLDCLILNACYSATWAEEFLSVAHHVIAVEGTISTEAAIIFSRTFYSFIRDNPELPFQDAVAQAKRAISAHASVKDAKALQLFPKPELSPEEQDRIQQESAEALFKLDFSDQEYAFRKVLDHQCSLCIVRGEDSGFGQEWLVQRLLKQSMLGKPLFELTTTSIQKILIDRYQIESCRELFTQWPLPIQGRRRSNSFSINDFQQSLSSHIRSIIKRGKSYVFWIDELSNLSPQEVERFIQEFWQPFSQQFSRENNAGYGPFVVIFITEKTTNLPYLAQLTQANEIVLPPIAPIGLPEFQTWQRDIGHYRGIARKYERISEEDITNLLSSVASIANPLPPAEDGSPQVRPGKLLPTLCRENQLDYRQIAQK